MKYKVVWAYHSGDLEREVNEILKQNNITEDRIIKEMCSLVIGNYEKNSPDNRKGTGTCLVQTIWYTEPNSGKGT